MNSGIKLWNKAIKVIPGGNGLLSKRPDRFVPDIWPTYYDSAKGCEIIDLDGNKYIDMSQMGIGTSILGYSNEEVNSAVKKAIDSGVNTTLNTPYEPELAEKLLEINSFAGGVKFARSGGEAMQIAVRIARAYTGKDKILFSGYHGWSDWYLATNISNKDGLSEHLLPGLDPCGVPNGLSNTAIPFKYNSQDSFDNALQGNSDSVAAVIIEGARNDVPTTKFIEHIKNYCRNNKVVFIVDEITSGWRYAFGGSFDKLNYNPDIAVYGKAMGNGFAISAVVGRKEVMDSAQDTFISSTFWTEKVGFAAALETLRQLEKLQTHKHIQELSIYLSTELQRIAKKNEIEIRISNFKPLLSFQFIFNGKKNVIETVFTQEMLKEGYLATTSIYLSQAHSKIIVCKYLKSVDKVFKKIKKAIFSDNMESMLTTRARTDSFKRLT